MDLPILYIVVASAGNASCDLGELVVVFSVQLHDQRVFFSRPNLVLFDSRVYVVVVALTALLCGAAWHHLRDLGPAAKNTYRGRKGGSDQNTWPSPCHTGNNKITRVHDYSKGSRGDRLRYLKCAMRAHLDDTTAHKVNFDALGLSC